MGKPSVTPPTVLRSGEVMPPRMGRPFVVSSTVFRSLRASVLCISMERGNLPSKKSTITGLSVVVSTTTAKKSCHFDICLEELFVYLKVGVG
jgi:hypothetical protein